MLFLLHYDIFNSHLMLCLFEPFNGFCIVENGFVNWKLLKRWLRQCYHTRWSILFVYLRDWSEFVLTRYDYRSIYRSWSFGFPSYIGQIDRLCSGLFFRLIIKYASFERCDTFFVEMKFPFKKWNSLWIILWWFKIFSDVSRLNFVNFCKKFIKYTHFSLIPALATLHSAWTRFSTLNISFFCIFLAFYFNKYLNLFICDFFRWQFLNFCL